VLGRSQATDEELPTTLVSIEAAMNSRPITQDAKDALTPAHFLCGANLKTLPYTTEPQREGNLKKTHQRTGRRLLETMGEGISHGANMLPANLSTKGEDREGPNRRHRPSPRGSAPQTHVGEDPGGGAEGGERRGHENGCTPWGERKCPGLPVPAGHSRGG